MYVYSGRLDATGRHLVSHDQLMCTFFIVCVMFVQMFLIHSEDMKDIYGHSLYPKKFNDKKKKLLKQSLGQAPQNLEIV